MVPVCSLLQVPITYADNYTVLCVNWKRLVPYDNYCCTAKRSIYASPEAGNDPVYTDMTPAAKEVGM
jgi:hypothetical protein